MWYTYTPLANGPVVISTCGSSYDTVLVVYTNSCGALGQLTCNDDNGPACGGLQASVSFAGTAGTTYHIQAAGFGGNSGSLHIMATLANDQCAGALGLLSGLPVTLDTATATSTGDPTDTCVLVLSNGVWFTYTPSGNGPVAVSTCGSSFDTVLQVYTGSCGAFTPLICSDDNGPVCSGANASVFFSGVAGTTYRILAGGYFGSTGTMQIVAQLFNDPCAGAIGLTAGTPYTMSTLDATSTGDPTPGCGDGVGKGVWFAFTPSVNGVVTVDTCGSDYDTVVQVFTGACGTLTPVANGCNDDSGACPANSVASFVEFTGSAGTLYHILVGGYDNDSGNLSVVANVRPPLNLTVNSFPNSGVFVSAAPQDISYQVGGNTGFTRTYASNTLVYLFAPPSDGFNVFWKWQLNGVDLTSSRSATVTMGANLTATALYVPPNDQCPGAIALTAGVPYAENTAGATATGDPVPTCATMTKGVWFTFTPASSGVAIISTCGSDFDTLLQVYTGACGALTPLPGQCVDDSGPACMQDLDASVGFNATAGTTYRIFAGGLGSGSGNLSIVASVVVPRTLTVNSFPANGVSVYSWPPDAAGLSGYANTAFSRTYGNGSVAYLQTPSSDGFNVFQKWQLDGVDFTNGTAALVTMGANHTATAVYVPPNDLCAGAIALAAGVPYTENTAGATSTGDPTGLCGGLERGVWFTFTPASSGVAIIDTCASDFDNALAVYTGACGALTLVQCVDDAGPSCYAVQSSVGFNCTAGTTYRILAGGYSGSVGNLSIVANVVAARTLTVNSSPANGATINVWPPDATGVSGDAATVFTRTYGNGSLVYLTAAASHGANVFSKWQLDGADLTTSQFATVTMGANHTATAVYVTTNDFCVGAIRLTNGLTFATSTVGATSSGDPPAACAPLSNGVWFVYTPAVNEEVTVSTCGSSFDTVIQVFTGTCGALKRVAYGCNDDGGPACAAFQASVVFSGLAGTNYYILVGGYVGDVGNLQIVAASGLVNDACAGALPLYYGVPFAMTTANATSTGDPTDSCVPALTNGVWFYFTSPITGPVPVSTCGSSFDTVLQVFTNVCGSLVPVACDDDNGPLCSDVNASLMLNAVAGVSYHILAGGYYGERGTLRIMVGTLPRLTVARTPGAYYVTWPGYYAPHYVLQLQTNGLGSGIHSNWSEILPIGPPYQVVPPAAYSNMFFRLLTP